METNNKIPEKKETEILPRKKTLIEEYISTSKFKKNCSQVVYMYDRERRYIDDIIQDFCYYYLQRPDKAPNIRKLYNLMITKLKYEKRYVITDIDDGDMIDPDGFEN
jgi:K+/H+ antiporter YhaU regulatory subunit KhtT